MLVDCNVVNANCYCGDGDIGTFDVNALVDTSEASSIIQVKEATAD